jgi:hypothetical protein
MRLEFLLKLEGSHGIPDSDWTRSAILESDEPDSVVLGAKRLVCAEHKRSTGEDLWDAAEAVTVKVTYGTTYLDVLFPGETYGYPLKYSVTPVLVVGARAFLLTEAEL